MLDNMRREEVTENGGRDTTILFKRRGCIARHVETLRSDLATGIVTEAYGSGEENRWDVNKNV